MSSSRFRTTYLLLGLFLILFILVAFFGSESAVQQQKKELEETVVFSEVEIESLTSVVFHQPNQPDTVLTKTNDSVWRLQTEPAYEIGANEMERLLTAIRELPRGNRVSKNKENWPRYELDEANVRVITLKKGEELMAELFFGKPGPSFQNHHMRRDQLEEVYLVNTDLPMFFAYMAEDWRNKQLLPFQLDQVRQLTARIGEERWAFSFANEKWSQVSESGLVEISDQEAVKSYLTALFELRGEGFEPDLKKFQKAELALALNLVDGSEYVVSFASGEENKYLAQVSGAVDLMTVSSDVKSVLRPSFLADLLVGGEVGSRE